MERDTSRKANMEMSSFAWGYATWIVDLELTKSLKA